MVKVGRPARYLMGAMLFLAGCGAVVRPTAEEVATRIGAPGFEAESFSQWLEVNRYEVIDLWKFGGPRPDGDVNCVEKARGGALFGVDVVRVCFAKGGAPVKVYSMQTHGSPWREEYPAAGVEVPR